MSRTASGQVIIRRRQIAALYWVADCVLANRRETMRFAVCKQKIKAVAARFGLAALALAMGMGAAGAIFHPGLLGVMQPSASASVFACKTTAEKLMPAAHDVVIEPQKLMIVTSDK